MISSHGKSSGFVCLRFSDKCVLVVFNPIQREQIKFQLTLKVLLWKIFHGCAVSERHRAFTAWIELGLPLLWKFDMQEFYNLVIWNWDYCQIIIAWYNLVWVRKYCLVRSRFSGPLMRRDFTLELNVFALSNNFIKLYAFLSLFFIFSFRLYKVGRQVINSNTLFWPKTSMHDVGKPWHWALWGVTTNLQPQRSVIFIVMYKQSCTILLSFYLLPFTVVSEHIGDDEHFPVLFYVHFDVELLMPILCA